MDRQKQIKYIIIAPLRVHQVSIEKMFFFITGSGTNQKYFHGGLCNGSRYFTTQCTGLFF